MPLVERSGLEGLPEGLPFFDSAVTCCCGLRLLETGPTAALLWGWDFRRVV